MTLDPGRATIIEAAGIATAICVALVVYLAYVRRVGLEAVHEKNRGRSRRDHRESNG